MTADEITLLQCVANQPEVLRGIAPGYLSVDLAPFFDNPANVMFGDDRGVVLFMAQQDGRYDMHYLFTSSLRGPEALATIKEGISALFTYHSASAITGSTPRENRPARAINRALGGRPYGVSVDSQGRHCIDYVLERATWVRLSGAQ